MILSLQEMTALIESPSVEFKQDNVRSEQEAKEAAAPVTDTTLLMKRKLSRWLSVMPTIK
jgi:hypothetical protein